MSLEENLTIIPRNLSVDTQMGFNFFDDSGTPICERMWNTHIKPEMYLYKETKCCECEGYNSKCERYRPKIM